jgi:hypothetical protein
VGSACARDEDPLPTEVGEHVEIYVDDGLVACGGTVPAFDRFVALSAEIWPERLPTDFIAEVSITAAPSICAPLTSCVRDGHAWVGDEASEYHELAHLIANEVSGPPPLAFREGSAEALGPTVPLWVEPSRLAMHAPDILLGESEPFVAAVFVRFLVERHEAGPITSFFDSIDGVSSLDELEAEYALGFSEPLDTAWGAFQAEPRCAYDTWYCDDGVGESEMLPLEVSDFACASDDVLGFAGAEAFSPYRILAFDIPADGAVTFDLQHVEGFLVRCGTCSAGDPPLPVGGPKAFAEFDLVLRAGRHALIAYTTDTGTPHIGVRLGDDG